MRPYKRVVTAMSIRPRREAVLQRVPIAGEGALPSLAALFHKTVDISGTGKRKIDGSYAATRLSQTMTSRWANERFRQVMLLVRQFRSEWPNQSLLSSDDMEFIRSAVDVALSSAAHEEHTGDIYDLNSTTWAIWLVQHVRAVRLGSWTAETQQIQFSLTFENLYDWLEEQHKRGEQFNVTEAATNLLIHRYKLPFQANMTVPPKKNEMFKWKKGAKRLSDWMQHGGFAPIDQAIQSLEPAKYVAPPPLQSQREATRAAMWGRVAERARSRTLTSVDRGGADAVLTRNVVTSVMNESRAGAPSMMSDAEADAFAEELEAELESQQPVAEPQPPLPQSAQSSSQSAAQSSSQSPLSEYEMQRLRNIARNQQVLKELGLVGASLGPPARSSQDPAREAYPPGRSGAAPSRRSNIEREAVDYAGGDSSEDEAGGAQEVGSTGAPPPGAVVIDLVSSEDEEEHTPAVLPPDPTRRDGLFVAPSQVPIESGPLAGSTLQEPGLFTSRAIPAGAFVCIYTGTHYSTDDFDSLPPARRDALSKYAVEVDSHALTIAPTIDEAGRVDLTLHAAAAANEPSASSAANSFAQSSVVELLGSDAEIHSYLVVCVYTCSAIPAGGEVLWNYGAGYESLRRTLGYTAGQRCTEAAIRSVRLPSPRGRVEAILADGRRVNDAIFEIELSSSSDTSDSEWLPRGPVQRRRKKPDDERLYNIIGAISKLHSRLPNRPRTGPQNPGVLSTYDDFEPRPVVYENTDEGRAQRDRVASAEHLTCKMPGCPGKDIREVSDGKAVCENCGTEQTYSSEELKPMFHADDTTEKRQGRMGAS